MVDYQITTWAVIPKWIWLRPFFCICARKDSCDVLQNYHILLLSHLNRPIGIRFFFKTSRPKLCGRTFLYNLIQIKLGLLQQLNLWTQTSNATKLSIPFTTEENGFDSFLPKKREKKLFQVLQGHDTTTGGGAASLQHEFELVNLR